MCSRNSPHSLNCHWAAMIVFHQLWRTAWSSRVHRTESVSLMGHVWSPAVGSTRSDHRLTFSLSILRGSGARYYKVAMHCRTKMTSTDRRRHRCACPYISVHWLDATSTRPTGRGEVYNSKQLHSPTRWINSNSDFAALYYTGWFNNM